MMEIISIVLIILIAYLILKLFAVFFHAGIWLLALPFKLLAITLSTLLVVFVLVPLGVIGGLLSFLAVPVVLAALLLPFLLIGLGLWLLIRHNQNLSKKRNNPYI